MKSLQNKWLSISATCTYFIRSLPILLQNRLFPQPVKISVASHRLSPRTGLRSSRGFTLVEMLVVLGIMAIMIGIAVVALPGIKGAADTTKAAYDISGALEYARTQAMAGSTYTWVAFYEEDPTQASGTFGKGQVVIAVFSSTDGTNLKTVADGNSSQLPAQPSAVPAGTLVQLSKILKIPNLHLGNETPLTTTDLPNLPVANTILDTVNNGDNGNSTTPKTTYHFNYPLTPIGGNPLYKFYQIIQFNPQGDASIIYDTPQKVIELGLRPARGNQVIASKNLVAIQIEGIGGKVTIYRP